VSGGADVVTKPLFEMLADYNAWANGRLYRAAASLPDEAYRADLGAFFGSVHGTLNHLLAADRIWMRRFTGTGEAPAALDAILFEDLPELRAAREAEDGRIAAYIGSLDEAALAAPLAYRTMVKPSEINQRLDQALIHFFNHQTHHRGQAHALLTRLTGEAPSLDLIVFQRETGLSQVRPL
jgi:uncharacterized damage-inducible protein DinB